MTEEIPREVQNTLDAIHERSESLELKLKELIGYAKVTSYVDGVTKIETSWKGLLLLGQYLNDMDDGTPAKV